jgi:starch synthase
VDILSVTSEAVPYIKTGGLADVTGALPGALERIGHRVVTVMPLYARINRQGLANTGKTVQALVDGETVQGTLWHGTQGTRDTYFIDCPAYFGRDGIYDEDGQAFEDNASRFCFFAQAALDLCQAIDFTPDVIHSHDWQGAMVPVYLHETADRYPALKRCATVLTIHNLAYQGVFGYREWQGLGLPDKAFSMDGMEFHGAVNFLKGGMKYADALTTVSKQYAEEIQQEAFGHGLDGVARFRSDDLYGIVNGIDIDLWNPATDATLTLPFGIDTIDGREANREFLRHAVGLTDSDGPVLGMVGRLAQQKGLSLVLEGLERLMQRNVRLVILGEGDPQIVADLQEAADRYGDRMKVIAGFDEDTARRIYAGCDLFLMPSEFEPCGLAQLIAMRYGALPVVHRVGGLADTVAPYDDNPATATGFAFGEFNAEAMLACIDQAIGVFGNNVELKAMQLNALNLDVSWDASARQYEKIYQTVMENNRAADHAWTVGN